MKRLVDQERNHGALMDAVFSLSAAMKEKPPLPPQKKPTVLPIAVNKKVRREEIFDVESSDGSDVEVEVVQKKANRHRQGVPDWYVESVEDLLVSEYQKNEEAIERLRREHRLFNSLRKIKSKSR